MCGRYAFAVRPSEVKRQFKDAGMPAEEAPDDEQVRNTYNFPPGSIGLVYRADVPDYGARGNRHEPSGKLDDTTKKDDDQVKIKEEEEEDEEATEESHETTYKLQAMKWGLIPSWTKRSPDYGSMLKTINCRDDSLAENRGMWTSMKKGKRCIVMCQGFYEWLKKNNGKERIPHFVKRKDGQLMCFAGLWDCVRYEGSDEKQYTYTIITTDSNRQLKFLHDRMPVILENGSEEIRTWLDPARHEWSRELQRLLRPYESELECYPVSKEVGKVGNNSPSFIVPIDSVENKSNIANFFHNQAKSSKGVKQEKHDKGQIGTTVAREQGETRPTVNAKAAEDNAPLPLPASEADRGKHALKREHVDVEEEIGEEQSVASEEAPRKLQKAFDADVSPSKTASRQRQSGRKARSATSNGSKASSPAKGDGSQKITAFFRK